MLIRLQQDVEVDLGRRKPEAFTAGTEVELPKGVAERLVKARVAEVLAQPSAPPAPAAEEEHEPPRRRGRKG